MAVSGTIICTRAKFCPLAALMPGKAAPGRHPHRPSLQPLKGSCRRVAALKPASWSRSSACSRLLENSSHIPACSISQAKMVTGHCQDAGGPVARTSRTCSRTQRAIRGAHAATALGQ